MAVVAPMQWWRLPFALSLAYQASVYKRCQLCGVYDCMPALHTAKSNIHHNSWFNRQQFICSHCHSKFDWSQSHFELVLNSTVVQGLASCYYQYPLNQIMLGFKNNQQLHYLPVLVHALRQLDIPQGCHPNNSVIIPVPTSTKRIQQRGFNPLAILAAYLSFYWGIPIYRGIGRYDRPHQQGLSREARLSNVKDTFYISDMPPTKNLILFDDVVTTGATLSELANLLHSSHTLHNQRIFACAILHG